jgi:hypothetical protein
LGSEGGVLTRVRLLTVSAVGRASSTVTARPVGRWRLLMSRRGAVHRWGPRGGGDCAGGRPEVAVHVEALVVARVEGIWRRRHGPEVDGASSGLGKLRWTGAQLLVVVIGLGARRSGPTMERRPQQRKRMMAWWCSGGSEEAHLVLWTVLHRGGTPADTEERGVAWHCSSVVAAASGAEERVRVRERGRKRRATSLHQWATVARG